MYTNKLFLTNINEINAALQKIKNSKIFNTLVLPSGTIEINNSILLPDSIFLEGQNTTLNFNLNNKDLSGIEFQSSKRHYIKNNTISNLTLVAKSPCKALIETKRSLRVRLFNLIGEAENLADHCVIIGDDNERGSVRSNIIDCAFFQGNKSAVHYGEAGNLHTIIDTALSRSRVGLSGKVTTLFLKECNLESNKENSINLEARNSLTLEGCYIENNNMNITGNRFFIAKNCKIGGGPINFNNLEVAKLEMCWFNNVRSIKGANKLILKYCDIPDRLLSELKTTHEKLLIS